jgi:outer membrane lipoprotein-sorting protein
MNTKICKNKKFTVVGAFSIVLLSVAQPANNAPLLKEFISQKQKEENNIKSVTFSFTQEIDIKLTNQKQKLSGKVYYMKPDKIRIDYDEPLSQNILLQRNIVHIYNRKFDELFTTNINDWNKMELFPKEMFAFAENYKNLEKRYIVDISTSESHITVTLLPKISKTISFKLYFLKEHLMPTKLEIHSKTFYSVLISTDVKYNSISDISIFEKDKLNITPKIE